MTIAGIYRHPNSNYEPIKKLISLLSKNFKNLIVLGDINVNLLAETKSTDEYINTIHVNNYISHINHPTRVTEHSKSVIDHIYTKGTVINKMKIYAGILMNDISDHYATFLTIQKAKYLKKENRKTRIFSTNNINKYNDYLEETNWNNINITENINSSCIKMTKIIAECYNKAFPEITLSIKISKSKPWISKGLIKCSKEKNRLYKLYRKNNDIRSKVKYIKYRNIFKKLIKKAENKYYQDILFKSQKDSKETWKILNKLTKPENTKKEIRELKYNQQVLNSNSAIANAFNEHFADIGKKLDENIIPLNDFRNYLEIQPDSIYLTDTTKEEIEKIISSLADKKSYGMDKLPSKAYKIGKYKLSELIMQLINMSFSKGIYPDCLKMGKVCPVFKNGSKDNPNNYRPITTLNTLAKIFEEAMKTRITIFLESKNYLSNRQFGFRKQHSTELAVVALTDNILNKINTGKKVGTIFIDLKKAFDTVNHTILLAKLNAIGIRGVAYKWLESYLKNREQFTNINNVYSHKNKLTIGVPQGSRLSPILYLIYVNDIEKFSNTNTNNLILFADDTSLTVSANNEKELEKNMNMELKLLENWFSANRLTLNSEKTNFIIYSNRSRTIQQNYNIKVKDQEIKRVKVTKYLGFNLDEKLNYKDHIEMILTKIRRRIPIIIKTKDKLNLKSKLKIYYALIYPNLLYGANLYGNSNKGSLKKLEKLHNKVIKILFATRNVIRSSEIRRKHKLISLNGIINMKKIQIVYQFLQNKLPRIISADYNEKIERNHNRVLRNNFSFPIFRFINNTTSRHSYNNTELWNNLNQNIKAINHYKKINNSLKIMCLE